MNCPDPYSCGNTLSTDQIKQAVVNYANGYQIDPQLALAQINRESRFNPCCVGGDGERGLAQILGTTWPMFAPPGVGFDQAFDVDYNLTTWGNYMVYLSGLFGGDMQSVLQAYNGGPGRVQRGKVSTMAQKYASDIIAQAPNVTVPDTVAMNGGGGNGGGSSLPAWLIISAIGLSAVIFMRN